MADSGPIVGTFAYPSDEVLMGELYDQVTDNLGRLVFATGYAGEDVGGEEAGGSVSIVGLSAVTTWPPLSGGQFILDESELDSGDVLGA